MLQLLDAACVETFVNLKINDAHLGRISIIKTQLD